MSSRFMRFANCGSIRHALKTDRIEVSGFEHHFLAFAAANIKRQFVCASAFQEAQVSARISCAIQFYRTCPCVLHCPFFLAHHISVASDCIRHARCITTDVRKGSQSVWGIYGTFRVVHVGQRVCIVSHRGQVAMHPNPCSLSGQFLNVIHRLRQHH